MSAPVPTKTNSNKSDSDSKSKSARAPPTCGTCGAQGHTSASLDCPIKKSKRDEEIAKFIAAYDSITTPQVDMSVVASLCGLCESACGKLYTEHITPLRELLRNIKYRGDPTPMTSCSKCSKDIFRDPKTWKGATLCCACHDDTSDERDALWAALKRYDQETGQSHCVRCKRERPMDANSRGFQYDHKHFLEKSDTMFSMIAAGAPLEAILEERGRCQLLCKDCHGFKTKLEEDLGFTRFKKNSTRAKNKAGAADADIEAEEREVYEAYAKIFTMPP